MMFTAKLSPSLLVSRLIPLGQKLGLSRPEHLAFVLSFIVLLVRAYFRIAHQGLWAEDANIFLNESFSFGFSALWQQYAGYYHTLPRLISLLTLQVGPLEFYPAITAVCCVLFTSYTFSRFAMIDYRSYVPNDLLRIFASIAFCFAPGLTEVAANLANLHWICFTLVWLLAIRPTNNKLTAMELVFAVLSIFSAGETVVCIPLLAWRAYHRRNLPGFRTDLVIVGACILSTAINLLQKKAHPPGEQIAFYDLLRLAPLYVSRSIAIDPVFGILRELKIDSIVSDIGFIVASTTISLSLVYTIVKKSAQGWVLVLAYLSTASVTILTWLVRPESEKFFGTARPIGDFHLRYSYITSISALVLWLAFLSLATASIKYSWRRFVLLAMFLVVHMISNTPRFSFPDFYTSDWRPFALEVQQLASSCQDRVIEHPAQPENWRVTFSASKSLYCPKAKVVLK